MAALAPNSLSKDPLSSGTPTIFGSKVKSGVIQQAQLRLTSFRSNTEPSALTRELKGDKQESIVEMGSGCDLFDETKNRENLEHFQALSKGHAPKFMVIACADSRVCPSNILGFQAGEAFMVCNVANMVPTYESGPSETNAALEFSVNSLEVENILIIGHSCCVGIRALMSMQEVDSRMSNCIYIAYFDKRLSLSSFIRSWVIVGKNVKQSTKAAASNLSFDQQCTHCEKVPLSWSLVCPSPIRLFGATQIFCSEVSCLL
ncbi:hypothetical protein CRYUN_Cryun06bG0067700 [Craigia yunnanensis]